jgi:hypothetical protein
MADLIGEVKKDLFVTKNSKFYRSRNYWTRRIPR